MSAAHHYDPPTGIEQRHVVATYDYTDASGNLIFQAVRTEPKGFYQRQPDGRDGWLNSVKGIDTALPYRLPEVLDTIPSNGTVLIVEGEKDADNLNRVLSSDGINAIATCNAGGAGKWYREHSNYLTGAKVVILPDNDAKGESHAVTTSQTLRTGVDSLKVVHLPSEINGHKVKDVSDALEAGYTYADIERLINAAGEYYPPAVAAAPSAGFYKPAQGLIKLADDASERARRWALTRLDNARSQVSRLSDDRHQAIYWKAKYLGSIAAHNILTESEAYTDLLSAASGNGSHAKYGQRWFEGEFRRGWRDGLDEPISLPDFLTRSKDDRKYAQTAAPDQPTVSRNPILITDETPRDQPSPAHRNESIKPLFGEFQPAQYDAADPAGKWQPRPKAEKFQTVWNTVRKHLKVDTPSPVNTMLTTSVAGSLGTIVPKVDTPSVVRMPRTTEMRPIGSHSTVISNHTSEMSPIGENSTVYTTETVEGGMLPETSNISELSTVRGVRTVEQEVMPRAIPASLANLAPRYIPDAVISFTRALLEATEPQTTDQLIESAGISRAAFNRHVRFCLTFDANTTIHSGKKEYRSPFSFTVKSETKPIGGRPPQLIRLINWSAYLDVLCTVYVLPRSHFEIAKKVRLPLPTADHYLVQRIADLPVDADCTDLAKRVNQLIDPTLTGAEHTAQRAVLDAAINFAQTAREKLNSDRAAVALALPDRIVNACEKRLNERVSLRKMAKELNVSINTVKTYSRAAIDDLFA